ncbi:twitching mobility protein, partial [Clostridium botulinum]|nr:twitching mobility protein [Clostridium botulinum]NFG32119.1 twitching mobility protein [Clostridium botulinum]
MHKNFKKYKFHNQNVLYKDFKIYVLHIAD